jgi:U4/U6.U5 tri-snRNP-associated protein 1
VFFSFGQVSANWTVADRREEDTAPQENGDEDGRITFDDTSEFVRNVTLESRTAQVKREPAASPPPAERAPEAVVVKIERGEDGEVGEGEDVDMDSEDEDEGLAEMAAREGLSLAEYRLKIDKELEEMSKIKAEDAEVCVFH